MKNKWLKEVQRACAGKNLVQVQKALAGEFLGEGLHRIVWVLKQNPDYVVKIEKDPSSATFANVTEWRNWINNKEWKFLADYLAPCELINETGQVLIQRRVTHRRRKDYPKYIPTMFTDLKLKNFGWIGDQFVCCDYAYIGLYIGKLGSNQMKFAKWWGSLKQQTTKK